MASSTNSLRAVLGVDVAAVADAATLTTCVLRLNESIDQIKATVYETVNRHYSEFTNTLTYALDVNSKVVELSLALETLTQRVDDPTVGIKAKMTNPLREYQQLKQQLAATDGIIVALRQLTRMHELLQQFDSTLELGEYQRASVALREISNILRDLPRNKENGLDVNIVKLVKGEYVRKKATFKHRLEELFSKAITVKVTVTECELNVAARLTGTLASEHFDNPTSLMDLLGAVETYGLLGTKAAALFARLMDTAVQPIVSLAGVTLSTRSVPKVGVALVIHKPKEKVTPEGKSELAVRPVTEKASGAVYKDLLQLFQFLGTSVFPAPHGAAVFPLWWEALAVVVVEQVLKPCIPDEETGLIAFSQTVAPATLAFEDEMIKLGFCTEDKRRLTAWTKHIHVHFWAKRRATALIMARELLGSADHNSVQVTDATERGGLTVTSEEKVKPSSQDAAAAGAPGKPNKEGLETSLEGLFKLETCNISVRTQSLVELVYQTLGECSKVQPVGATQLYYTARDMLDLFRAVVPVFHANEIDNVPQLSMLFVNDCHYIAHHLMTLGFQFQGFLPPPLKDTATFVDMVPLFRRLADLQYQQQMVQQRQQILEFVASCNGFGDTHEDRRYEIVERGLKQALHLLTQLAKVWMPILPTSLYFSSMGSLTSTLLEAFCKGILALTDIAEEETHQLHQLCQFVQRQVTPLFSVKTPNLTVVKTESPAKHCSPHWERVDLIDRLLTMSLVDIDAAYSSGKLLVLAKPELRKLVVALFTQSPKREALLKRIAQD